MPKKKITISLDDRLLNIIDKQRGSTKRSTYINNIITQHFKPVPDAEAGGGTFVTTLELRKTLKGIHDRLKLLDAVSYNVNDLEAIVYEYIFDAGPKATKGKKGSRVKTIQHNILPEMISKSREMGTKAKKEVDKWIDGVLDSYGDIIVERDIASWKKLRGVEGSALTLVKELRSRGMTYIKNEQKWVKP